MYKRAKKTIRISERYVNKAEGIESARAIEADVKTANGKIKPQKAEWKLNFVLKSIKNKTIIRSWTNQNNPNPQIVSAIMTDPE